MSKREEGIQKKEEELLKREKGIQKQEEKLKREKEAFQKEKNNIEDFGIIESERKQYGKDEINKTKKSAQTHDEKKEQNDNIRNLEKEKEISTKNEIKFNDSKGKENTSQQEIIDNKSIPIIAKSNEEKKMNKNKNALDFRKNENIVNISEASFGENMPKTNYIDAKNKEIVDAEKYNVVNEEKKEDPVQNIINENLAYGNSNGIERNDEKVIKMGDGDVCSNEEKRNIVIKNEGEGKDNFEEMKGGKEENRQDNLLPEEHQKQKDEKTRK